MKKRVQYFLALTTILMMTACQSQQQTSQVDEEKQVEIQEPEVKKTEITLSFVGDITLGNYIGQGYEGSFDQEYEKQNQDSAYYLKNVKDVFEKDDLTGL